MDTYNDFISSLQLNQYDKHICNYLLIDNFEIENSKMENILKILSMTHSPIESYMLVICGLYSVDFRTHNMVICPKPIYENYKKYLSDEKLFYIKIYRQCSDSSLIKFIDYIFNKKLNSISCAEYFKIVSKSDINFDETLEDNVSEFYKLHMECEMEIDGLPNRKRIRNPEKVDSTNSIYYSINPNRENFCLIFNNKLERDGSEKDVDEIEKTFSKIKGFKVKKENLTTKENLFKDLKKYISLNSVNSDMIVCFFMSHGDDNILFDINQLPITFQEIENEFSAKNAITLAGKPKILIYQSCRGVKKQEVIQFDSPPTEMNPDFINNNKYLPPRQTCINLSDYFIINSTIPGHSSIRLIDDGTWFIQTFCNIIQHFSRKHDLDELCVLVNNKPPEHKEGEVIYSQLCQVSKTMVKFKVYLESPYFSNTI